KLSPESHCSPRAPLPVSPQSPSRHNVLLPAPAPPHRRARRVAIASAPSLHARPHPEILLESCFAPPWPSPHPRANSSLRARALVQYVPPHIREIHHASAAPSQFAFP